MQSSSTVNLHSSTITTTTTGGRSSGVAGDNSTEGEVVRPFIRLMPIEIPQPVYFDESSASEEDDYDYDDGEYSSDGYSDSYDHPHSRHNSNHRRRTHRSSNTHEYSDDDDTDLVEHHRNKRGLASSPSYLDSAALNGRTTSGTDAYGYEQSMSREQADYRRSKEEEDEDLSYLSPVSGNVILFVIFGYLFILIGGDGCRHACKVKVLEMKVN